MIDPNFDKFPQAVFTIQATDADYFASHFPWQFEGWWLSDCCLVDLDELRMARISLTESPKPSVASGDYVGQEFSGMRVEIVHRTSGPLIEQTFPFIAYIELPNAMHKGYEPRLIKAKASGKFSWFIGKDPLKPAPNLNHFCNAVMAFMDMMKGVSGGQEPLVKAHHRAPPLRTDAATDEPVVIMDDPPNT